MRAQATNTHSADLESDSSQYASINNADQTGLALNGDFTLMAWAKPESLSGSQMIVGKNLPFFDDSGYTLGLNGGNFFVSIGSGSSNTTWQPSYGTELAVGTWTHVALTYKESTGALTLYTNGSYYASTTGITTLSSANGAQFCIGSAAYTCPNYPWDGLVDDVRVYNIELSSSDISSTYNCALVGDEAGLVGYWKLDNSLLDETTNNNDLTNNGSFVFSTDVNFTDNCGGAVTGTELIVFE